MRVNKKTITKEDGRALTYYHFPDSATDSQKSAFYGVATEAELSNSAAPIDKPDGADV